MSAAIVPSDSELSRLAAEVDQQLARLRSGPPEQLLTRGRAGDEPEQSPDAPAQRLAIEQATGQPFETFWRKYLRHARRDLCLPGGMLHEQWRKWRDLESKSVVRNSYLWLAAIGVSSGVFSTVAVAASVFLLNVVAKVGIETICEGCTGEDGTCTDQQA